MSTLAVECAFKRDILPRWQAAGGEIRTQWSPTTVLMRDIGAGARADVVVLIDAPMAELADRGVVRRETIVPIARANFGVATLPGASRPDISTPEAFLAAMASARVTYSLTGASGLWFAEILRSNGAEAALERAVAIPEGFTAEKLVSGEADLAVQQISELMSVDGVEILGPFPEPFQRPTDFSAAIFTEAADPQEAERFLDFLQSAASEAAYRAGGLDPRLARTPA
ncbi:ABC transporter substrate-binding protein [Amaricoccus solimangrovi]|uniref:ABC transporter substrate-binding protein n=2 Tax=Amaricoccus solimangrovi TaxID=2589815 RepID=A0A501WK91_9RHOB|nr:ABC transporter substrate-binding protein [Amaricoccus solimangrovi]